MAPRRREESEEEENVDRSAEYYIRQRNEFDESKLTKRNYGDSSIYLQNLVKRQWEKYFHLVGLDSHKALEEFTVQDLSSFFRWLLRESRGSVDSFRSVQTYWNVLCIVRRQETGRIEVDPATKHSMIGARQHLIKEFGLRTEPKDKPIMRAEDEFECLKTLWESPEMIFDMEVHRLGLALIIQLAGITGNRPKALLKLRFKHVKVALLPDPEGGEWPRPLIEWKFNETKGYLGEKDANEIPVPDIPNEPCLLLCPHTTFLSLAFLYNAFAAPDLTPERFYNLKVLPGQGQQPLPWKDEMEDVYLFRKSVRTALEAELSSDHLPYSTLRPRLLKVGEVTGIGLPVGAYCFRRGNGEALDSSSYISDAQRNLCLQHAPNSTVFQRNYLSRHITADTQAAYRGLQPQTAMMRAATGLKRTINKKRPRHLTLVQEEEAHQHPRVQKLLRKKLDLKAWIKAQGRTVTSYQGTDVYEKYQRRKRDYESEFEFQKKAFLKEIKKKFEKEQPVIDVQNQIHGLTIKEEKDAAINNPKHLIPERARVIDALFTFATSSLEEERKRRVKAINALVALGHVQDGYYYPVRRQKRLPLSPVPKLPNPLSLECKPTQCFLCLGNKKAPLGKRTREFHSRGDLKKHLHRYHIDRHDGPGPIICPLDGEELRGAQEVLGHAHSVHKTPTLLCR
ncbi:hypothetical protein K432DRAFT_430744 [Lepidopterella palustris CBS 459.81]|uniref:Uncharacterized protein n=1 Tax=Lepidopterella palustris CBS 459.81 TaxID=1314670 RepID=A0A8E2J8D9_9PEZI|nr:hypothetical protein K432DRAFT_430744 [Lepidopterella palustris CBS 459.81]